MGCGVCVCGGGGAGGRGVQCRLCVPAQRSGGRAPRRASPLPPPHPTHHPPTPTHTHPHTVHPYSRSYIEARKAGIPATWDLAFKWTYTGPTSAYTRVRLRGARGWGVGGGGDGAQRAGQLQPRVCCCCPLPPHSASLLG